VADTPAVKRVAVVLSMVTVLDVYGPVQASAPAASRGPTAAAPLLRGLHHRRRPGPCGGRARVPRATPTTRRRGADYDILLIRAASDARGGRDDAFLARLGRRAAGARDHDRLHRLGAARPHRSLGRRPATSNNIAWDWVLEQGRACSGAQGALGGRRRPGDVVRRSAGIEHDPRAHRAAARRDMGP